MKIKRKSLITAGGTLMCALGIGYFMQGSAQPTAQDAGVTAGVASTAPAEPPQVELEQVTLTSAASTTGMVPAVASLPVVEAALEQEVTPDAPPAAEPERETEPELACDYEMTATPEAAAMVRLALSAPCMVNERFTLHHNGMMVSQVTDIDGTSTFLVPALAETAVFIAAFANSEGAVATAEVPSLALYDRAVLQWRGATGMQLHAFEFGADYTAEGHVWAESSRDLSTAAAGEGGFISRHGVFDLDDALLAEVYTFPTAGIQRDGDVALSVEAEVTAANCGRDVEAQSIQKSAGGELKTQVLTLAMPECDAVGDFLVLKNLLNDLKIAAK